MGEQGAIDHKKRKNIKMREQTVHDMLEREYEPMIELTRSITVINPVTSEPEIKPLNEVAHPLI